jgi:GNAT superfamily N-acetyltransferase
MGSDLTAAGTERIRVGDEADAPIVLSLFDASVRWQVERGFSAQWGDRPFSEIQARVESVRRWAGSGGLRICERDGRPAAALVLGDAPSYVRPATEPEIYVVVLVGAHEPFARGAGARLLELAADEARGQGVRRLRVDCYAGNGGGLVGFYERCGFRRVEPFTVGDWPGQVLERVVAPARAHTARQER